jgi:glycine C-acetyltransferase
MKTPPTSFEQGLAEELKEISAAGLWKEERVIVTPQDAEIKVSSGEEVVNFCANNYLGLSDDPELIKAATRCLQERGFGMSSVRFICGTQDIHKQLEE